MLFLGVYLNERDKKRKRKEWAPSEYHRWLSKVIRDPRMAHEQLRDAIERDDFEEAARLRDLINKK